MQHVSLHLECMRMEASRGCQQSGGCKRLQKERGKQAKEMSEFFSKLNDLCDKVQSNPLVWNREEFKRTRALIMHFLQHAEDFPLDNGVLIETIVPSATRWFGLEELQSKLTNGFVHHITDHSWSFDNGIEHPVVQVLHTDQVHSRHIQLSLTRLRLCV